MPSVATSPSPAPARNRVSIRTLLLVAAAICTGVGLFCWYTGALGSFASWQIGALLVCLCLLNAAPFVLEVATRTFDPFDPKHVFLAYFFIVFTFHSLCRTTLGIGTNPALATPEPSDDLRVRALSAIALGLGGFIAGCYLPGGRLAGRLAPRLPMLDRRRGHLAAALGISAGLAAFILLMKAAGGNGAFLAYLGTWRTSVVIAGVGYLTFPIAIVLPASALLLLLQHLPRAPKKISWAAVATILLYLGSLAPVIVLGFRGNLLPAILQFLAAWHYGRRRLRVLAVGMIAAVLLLFLSVYGVIRSVAGGETRETNALATAVLFRVPGLDTVERVIARLDRGEPHRGIKPGLIEAATILVPRSVWAGKPEPASLAFADIFFFDFFLERGDPLDGVKSGVSPTLVAEMLWIGGLPGVALAGWMLGTLVTAINTWRQRAPHHPLHILVGAIFMGWFAIFVEAPQNTLNTFVMLTAFCLGLALVLTFRLRRRPARSVSALGLPAEAGATTT